MLKKMSPEKAKELRDTLAGLRSKLGMDSGKALKARKDRLHPVAAALEVHEEVEPLKVRGHDLPTAGNKEPRNSVEAAHDEHKAAEGHMFSDGGEVPAPREMPAPEKEKRRDPGMPERRRELPPDSLREPKKEHEPEMAYAKGGMAGEDDSSDHEGGSAGSGEEMSEAHRALLERIKNHDW